MGVFAIFLIATCACTARAIGTFSINFKAISAPMKRNYLEAALFGYQTLPA